MAPAGTNAKIEELRFKVKTDPKSRHFYPLAEELRKVGQPGEAESVLRAGLTAHPTYLSAWVVLGRVLREQQKHRDAVEALTKALDLDRGNVVAARLLADSYMELGEKIEAIKKYKLVHALMPGDDEVEATIHRLQTELTHVPAKSLPLSEPPSEELASDSASATTASAPAHEDADVFETTYSRLKREARLEIETGDTEPMAALHAESPFEEPAAEAGYSADAFEIERPAGVHLAATPLEADLPSPFPPLPLPPETSPAASPEPLEDAGVAEREDVAPGFIRGSFDANASLPPVDEDVFAKTLTMADLYASQGLIDEARDIYEDILARDPDNVRVRAKLDALSQQQPARFDDDAVPTEADEDATLELRSGVRYTPAPLPEPPPAADDREADDREDTQPQEQQRATGTDVPVFAQQPDAPLEEVAAPAAANVSQPKVEKLQNWLARVKRPGAGGV